jgi:pimeloyl-ACP methyl ester carboxylesterase
MLPQTSRRVLLAGATLLLSGVGGFACTPEARPPASDATAAETSDAPLPRAGLQAHTVDVDGHPIAVWEKSPAEPRGTLVLIHGRTWSGLPDFDLQVEGEELSLMDGLVAEGFSTFAVDLRGYGGTPRDSTGWITPDRAARDVIEILGWVADRSGQTPSLFGWSNGAMVSQLVAQRSPASMETLILFGYPGNPDAAPRARGPEPGEPPREPTTAEAAASDFIIPGSISQRAIDEYVRHALEADPIRSDWTRLDQWNDLEPEAVRVPTLLIQGERDPLAPTARQAVFFSRLGTADRQWVTIPGGDHAAFLETPRPAFIHALVTFLTQPR